MKRILNRLSVRQKIRYGYALTIGIAVLGILPILLIEGYYQKQTGELLAQRRQAVKILRNLEGAVLQAQGHQQILAPLLTNADKFEQEYSEAIEELDKACKHWVRLSLRLKR